MKRFLTLFLLTVLIQLPGKSQDLLASVPEDTLAVFVIHDLPSLETKREITPLRHLPQLESLELASPELQSVLTHLRQLQAQIDGEVLLRIANPGAALKDLMALQQERGLLWENLDLSAEEDPELDDLLARQEAMRRQSYETLRALVVFQAHIRDAEAVEALLADLKTHLPALHWAVENQRLTLTFSETGVTEAKALLNADEHRPLSATPDFLQTMEALGRQDTLMYVNLPQIVALFAPILETIQEETPQFDLAPFTAWLEPEALLPMAFSSYIAVPPRDLILRSHYGFRRETGLASLLLGKNDAPAPTPEFVHRDVDQMLSMHWHPAETLRNVQLDLSRLSPQLGIAFGFFKMTLNVNLGLDIETQFLQTLGSGLTIVSVTDHAVVEQLAQLQNLEDPAALLALSQQYPTGGLYYLIGFELEDADTFRTSLETLITKLTQSPLPAPIQDGDIEKTFLFTHATGLPAELRTQIAGTFLGDHWLLAVGDTSLLHRAHEAQQDESLRLWTQEDYLATRATLPAEAQSLNYTSGKELQNSLRQLQTGAEFLSMLSGGAVTFSGSLPEAPLFLNSIGTAVRKDQRFINETRLRFAPAGTAPAAE